MFDNLKAKIFPCENVLKKVREDHAAAARNNEGAHDELKRVCNTEYSAFKHMVGKENHIVNPR